MTGKGSGKRGRPLGYRLSESSKRAISMAKTGQKHRQETREKISKSLLNYFKRKSPLSEEITNRYCRCSDDLMCDWLYEVQEDLDMSPNIMTEKTMNSKGKIEISCGNNIEFYSHNITPELILLIKEHCRLNNIDIEDFIEESR